VFVSEKAVADADAECVRTDSAAFGLTQRASVSEQRTHDDDDDSF